MGEEIGGDLANLGRAEAVASREFRRSLGAREQYHRFAFRADDVHVRRRVVVGIDGNA